ncbi:PREDICTED: uncharacterized protein LOC105129373 [Populus euphratica]|uniref:Uncharacterized protein LOC105129373 n=1 Tax=Populus euphratica TaxID=75702 RepID=A0AAJ6UHP7_POPEU|nr:PREDICTED: uncharacterized protein LOC105129373 [Populus euphratica]
MVKRKITNMIRIPPFSSSTSMAQTNNQELQENQSKDMDEELALAMETMGKERERKRKKMREEGGLPLCQDPLDLLGRDLMLRVLNNVDARSVARCLVVSRSWNRVASSDLLWTSKCEELWHGKAHLPRLSLVRGVSKLDAYSLSVIDGKRTRIVKDDLCDHVWDFHFTKVAPEYWRNLDPYWKGNGPPMHRYFHQDGSQTADPGDKVWGGHECCYSIVTSMIGGGKIREHYVRINGWLPLAVSRKQDWSWEMSNNFYCYSSVPDAYKEGGTGPLFLVM